MRYVACTVQYIISCLITTKTYESARFGSETFGADAFAAAGAGVAASSVEDSVITVLT